MSTKYGAVKWFNESKGYGFIRPDDGGPDVFLHARRCREAGLAVITPGMRLGYRVEQKRGGLAGSEAVIMSVGGDASSLVRDLIERSRQLANGSTEDDIADAWLMRSAADAILARVGGAP